jgi:hypothetical protein
MPRENTGTDSCWRIHRSQIQRLHGRLPRADSNVQPAD